ncbi:MAG: N-acetyl-gamma-glutamyl-phosphate reductase [Candidatus Omnitrophica bacterium]|nr:N-acetyl-gamma-glutamyl-phosphate reductase [Candidatus Omnitrophota bacterium]
MSGSYQKTKVGIAGVTGYTGEEVLTWLLKHPRVELSYVAASEDVGSLANRLPRWADVPGIPACEGLNAQRMAGSCDVALLALPHTQSMAVVPGLLKAGVRVVDLSADYRLREAPVYEKWYQHAHTDTANIANAVYGLCEYCGEELKQAQLVANPGCYPTAVSLALLPLLKSDLYSGGTVIVDAKSGVTGAGRKVAAALQFSEVNENLKAYKVAVHQHTPEMLQTLKDFSGFDSSLVFVPHLIPMNRGIVATCYVPLKAPSTSAELKALYETAYAQAPFVRIKAKGEAPETAQVAHTNYCDIGVFADESGNTAVVISAIDNLAKGAATQAIQNLNRMMGWPETEGLLR